MVVSGLMPFQRAKSSNPLSLFGDKIGRWMDKVLPPILPAPAALPARTTIEVTTQKTGNGQEAKGVQRKRIMVGHDFFLLVNRIAKA